LIPFILFFAILVNIQENRKTDYKKPTTNRTNLLITIPVSDMSSYLGHVSFLKDMWS
jgi:hypothetical protein